MPVRLDPDSSSAARVNRVNTCKFTGAGEYRGRTGGEGRRPDGAGWRDNGIYLRHLQGRGSRTLGSHNIGIAREKRCARKGEISNDQSKSYGRAARARPGDFSTYRNTDSVVAVEFGSRSKWWTARTGGVRKATVGVVCWYWLANQAECVDTGSLLWCGVCLCVCVC